MTTRALLTLFALGLCALAAPAHAARTVNDAVMDYGSQVNATRVIAPPGATIQADVTVRRTRFGAGGALWRSTSWRIGGGPATCVDHVNFDVTGTDQVTFGMTAPAAVGRYDLTLVAYADDACTSGASRVFRRAGAVTVSNADQSTVSANPATVPADGVTASTISVTLIDSGGAPRVGRTVTLAALSGSSTISAPSGPSNAFGVVTFTVSDAVPETVTYRATNVTDSIVIAQTASVTFQPVVAVLNSFNAVDAKDNPVSGVIRTKVAGATFSLDIVAQRGSPAALDPTFNGTVRVQFVNAAGGGACDSLPPISGLQDVTLIKGRRTLNGNNIAAAYREVRVRIYPTVGPPSCSGDRFANRPANLAIAVTHTDRVTAGPGPALNNVTLGGEVHNAGRPFTIAVTAYNALPKPTVAAGYDGDPAATLGVCGGAACTGTLGTLSLGAWSTAGAMRTATASYDEVGAFRLQLADTNFADADLGDSSIAERAIPPASVDVGRFVPDRFVLSAGSVTPRVDIAACLASPFTYIGEPMRLNFRLTAVNAAGTTTALYAGALARLPLNTVGTAAPYNAGAIDMAAPTPLALTPRSSNGTWTSAGVADVAVEVAAVRGAREGPYANVRLGIAPADPDGVALDPAALDLDADNNGTPERARVADHELRFGRLRLQNAHGSELIPMVVPIAAQYWNGTTFVTNQEDDCTPITAANVAFGNYRRNLSAGETTVSAIAAIANGEGTLRLSPPGAGNAGSADLSVNLTNAAAGASCTPGMGASAGSTYSYLQGAWCTGVAYNDDPTARVTFGIYRSNARVIFQRENF